MAKEKDSDLRADIAAARARCAFGKGTGLVVLTDQRLLFVQDGIMSQTSEDFPMVKASGNKSEITNGQQGRRQGDRRQDPALLFVWG